MTQQKLNNILVTGAGGQLGESIKSISANFPSLNIAFADSNELDVTNSTEVLNYIESNKFNYIINCAAYTAVDKAEDEEQKAYSINAEGVSNIAKVCKQFNMTLIHISTDFVFDGLKEQPYTEVDETNPLNVYGASKFKGEQRIQETLERYFIIRTSWLFSEFGNNFVKTMSKLGQVKEELNIVADQYGSPTYAVDLAYILLKLIEKPSTDYGIYHVSNDGVTTWYNFAAEIFKLQNKDIRLHKTTSKQFASKAIRPKYSVLETKKVKETLNVKIRNWQSALKEMLSRL